MTVVRPSIEEMLAAEGREKFHQRLDEVLDDIVRSVPLNMAHIGNIFGPEFWALLVLCQTNITVNPEGNIELHVHVK